MDKQMLSALRMRITKVQALVKVVELAQRGLATEQSKEVALCMQAAHKVLESISEDLSAESKKSAQVRLLPNDRLRSTR